MSREACWLGLDGVLACRTSDVSMGDSLKLGTARSRIRIGEESNGFPVLDPLQTKSAKTTPCTVGMSLKSLAFISPKSEISAGTAGLLRLRDLGRLGAGDEGGGLQHGRPERGRHFQPERD